MITFHSDPRLALGRPVELICTLARRLELGAERCACRSIAPRARLAAWLSGRPVPDLPAEGQVRVELLRAARAAMPRRPAVREALRRRGRVSGVAAEVVAP